jgi:DNA-directed RNA polymerase subunit M
MIETLFCPKCGSILKLVGEKKKKLKCANCGYTPRGKKNLVLKEKVKVEDQDKIEVRSKKVETLPVIKAECKKCGNSKAYYWLVQTRAADEAETRFFECTKCGFRWREY